MGAGGESFRDAPRGPTFLLITYEAHVVGTSQSVLGALGFDPAFGGIFVPIFPPVHGPRGAFPAVGEPDEDRG